MATVDVLPFLSVTLARKDTDLPFAGFLTVIAPLVTAVYFQVRPAS